MPISPLSAGFVIHKRVMGELAISRAIGDSGFKEKDCVLVTAEPEIQSDVIRYNKKTKEDTFILLACDGLFDVMPNDEVCMYGKTSSLSWAVLPQCWEETHITDNRFFSECGCMSEVTDF